MNVTTSSSTDGGARYRVSIDIGGTFTDTVISDTATGEFTYIKTLTTYPDPSVGAISALETSGIDLQEVGYLVHGSTIAINTLLQSRGSKTGIIATAGFSDVLELRRGARTHLLDPRMPKPVPIVSREMRKGVRERIDADGHVLEALDEEGLENAVDGLVEAGLESLVISFLNSHVNSTHEHRAAEVIRRRHPQLSLTLGSEIVPEIDEYRRTSTAALNAYIKPTVSTYIQGFASRMDEVGVRGGLRLMHSGGGIVGPEYASMVPIHLLESGPAAGVSGAAAIGKELGLDQIITFDMGGTTSKTSVVEQAEPLVTFDYELFEQENRPGSGWPVRVPMIDIVETGAGGGSIAYVGEDGGLHVGPQSAGADPGPVCYGRGGVRPTVTDAHAALGRLVSLADGTIPLDVGGAREAILRDIAGPLGLSIEEAAAGILQIANAKTADVLREVTIARGRDPRDYTLVAFGGAGPLEAASLIEELDMERAVIPPVGGNFSAGGMLVTDVSHDSAESVLSGLGSIDDAEILRVLGELEADVAERLERDGVAAEDVSITYLADARYHGQFVQLTVPFAVERIGAVSGPIRAAFEDEYRRLYRIDSADEEVELVTIRVRGSGSLVHGDSRLLARGSEVREPRHRQVYFAGDGNGWLDTVVLWAPSLAIGSVHPGPLVIEEETCTTLVPPRYQLKVVTAGALVIEREGQE